MDEKYLKWFYTKYIDVNIYRVVSEEYLEEIKSKGIEPDVNPFHNHIPQIKELFALLMKLESGGFAHTRQWGGTLVTAEKIIRVSTTDIDNPFVDFTASYNKTYYYRRHRGGALVTTIYEITSDILKRKPVISKKELQLVNSLHEWSSIRASYINRVLYFNGTSRYFESAHFQMIGSGKDYIESPFGRYDHFKQVIEKNGIDVYEPYLKNKDDFYLRAIERIPASEIKKVY